MILEGLVVGMFQSNCYVVGDETTREALIVDPGDEAKRILAVVDRHHLDVKLIAVTHSHVDHVAALEPVRESTGADVVMHHDAYESSKAEAGMMRTLLGVGAPKIAEPHLLVDDDDELSVGNLTFKVLYTPGHAFGHICLAGEGVVFTGDALFAGGIGRFDLPGGDGKLLLKSIRQKLLTLPDETVVLSGHGPASTIGEERTSNPFLLYPRMYMGVDSD
jgi:hydroxyacylglutathione hydrolase